MTKASAQYLIMSGIFESENYADLDFDEGIEIMCKFLIWGTGCEAEKYGALLWKMKPDSMEVIGFVDSNAAKRGKLFLGKTVYLPDELGMLDYDYIAIWSYQYYDEIYCQAVDRYAVSPDRIKDIFSFYKQKLEKKYTETDDEDLKEIIHRIREQRGVNVFYFEPSSKEEVWHEVYFDDKVQLQYIYFEGKRMYLKRNFDGVEERNGKQYVRNMYEEQDVNSPHRYEGGNVYVETGDILVDAGVCEGNFSLHHIDKVKKVYLIECDREWMEALHCTFEPYKEKVVFCEKFLSNVDSEQTIKLDTLVTDPVDFIKMDIEGEEIAALQGGRKTVTKSDGVKCAVCSYHRHGDEEKIKQILGEMGLKTHTSDGYMLFLYDEAVLTDPEFRRGVVRGRKG